MLPINTSQILSFLCQPADSLNDFSVTIKNGIVSIVKYDEAKIGRPQPTEQEIIDAGNDLTQVNGQTFSQWGAEHGADPTLTARRKAKEEVQGKIFLKAIVKYLVDEINVLRSAQTPPLQNITYIDAIDAIKSIINSGNAD